MDDHALELADTEDILADAARFAADIAEFARRLQVGFVTSFEAFERLNKGLYTVDLSELDIFNEEEQFKEIDMSNETNDTNPEDALTPEETALLEWMVEWRAHTGAQPEETTEEELTPEEAALRAMAGWHTRAGAQPEEEMTEEEMTEEEEEEFVEAIREFVADVETLGVLFEEYEENEARREETKEKLSNLLRVCVIRDIVKDVVKYSMLALGSYVVVRKVLPIRPRQQPVIRHCHKHTVHIKVHR